MRRLLVIHEGIDGYSRVPVYLKVASTNKAVTALMHFCKVSSVMDYHLMYIRSVEEKIF